MAQALRHPDRRGRCGGEAFLALLSGLPLEAAAAALERLSERVQAGDGFNAAVARAKALLHRAQREGRNRVVCAPSAPVPAPCR